MCVCVCGCVLYPVGSISACLAIGLNYWVLLHVVAADVHQRCNV